MSQGISNPVEILRASEKFRAWHVEPMSDDDLLKTEAMDVKHYSPDELATLWGVSAETIQALRDFGSGAFSLLRLLRRAS